MKAKVYILPFLSKPAQMQVAEELNEAGYVNARMVKIIKNNKKVMFWEVY